MDLFFEFGSAKYLWMAGILVLARGSDFLSTYIATPNLVLEANPLARKMGWKWGLIVNLALCGFFSCWPLLAIVVATTSILVAARNFQSAWLMRSLGEDQYRHWMVGQLQQVQLGLYLFCLLAQTSLVGAVGAALVWFSETPSIPFAVGVGIIGYALAIALYTLLSLWRIRH